MYGIKKRILSTVQQLALTGVIPEDSSFLVLSRHETKILVAVEEAADSPSEFDSMKQDNHSSDFSVETSCVSWTLASVVTGFQCFLLGS